MPAAKVIPSKTGLNINLVFAALIIVFGSSLPFGYNIGVLNQPESLIKDFQNVTYDERYGNITEATLTLTWSLTTALFIPGGMIGAFLGGWLADSFGRKRTIMLSHIFVFIGVPLCTACVAARSPELLMLGRIFLGINSGMGLCIAPVFLSEIAPFNYRGAFGTMHQLFITVGIFISSIFGITYILGTTTRWPYLMLLELVPAITSLIAIPFLPETPRYLLLVKNDREGAIQSLKFYRKTTSALNDLEEMDTENQQSNSSGADKEFTLGRMFASADLRRPLFIACMLQVVQQFSGINAVFFFSKSIYENARVKETDIQYAVVGTNAVNVFMTIIAVPLMDVAGRRLLLLVPMVAMIFDLAAMTICRVLYAQNNELTFLAYGSVVCVIIYVIAFAVGLGPIPMMIGSELFRQGPRPLAMAIAGFTNWICTFLIVVSFPSIQKALGDYTFVIFMVFLIGFTVFTYFFVPETKNKTFEEIAHQFSPGGHIEVEEMVGKEKENPPSPVANEDSDVESDRLVTLNFSGNKDQKSPTEKYTPRNV